MIVAGRAMINCLRCQNVEEAASCPYSYLDITSRLKKKVQYFSKINQLFSEYIIKEREIHLHTKHLILLFFITCKLTAFLKMGFFF